MKRACILLTATLIFTVISVGAGSAWKLEPVTLGNPPPTPMTPSPGSPITDPQGAPVRNIPPLYVQPKLQDEGVWLREDPLGGHDQPAFIYRTVYRPSERFPNSIVYMMLLNMKHLSAKLYLGSGEPYRNGSASGVEEPDQPRLMAITNALWQTRHAGLGGIILRGQVLKEMAPKVATLLVYKNGAVDIDEWDAAIPVSEVQDARQLHHLIVKDGTVVTSLTKRGKLLSAEIGLGSLLNEDRPVIKVPGASPEEKPAEKLNFTAGDLWFLANRSGFGIRPDGNLVFAVGHHISTMDLAKALVLAGCVRGMHGDANPGNCVGIVYVRNSTGEVVKRIPLSPLQDKGTMDRYVKGSYPKDFVGFFRR